MSDFELIITNPGDSDVDVDLHLGSSHNRYTVPAGKKTTVQGSVTGCMIVPVVVMLVGSIVAML